MKLVYNKEQFDIYQSDDGYVIVNHDMEGFAHTHMEHLSTAKYICDLAISKKIPHDLKRYLIISLIRISDDKIYVRKLNELLAAKKKKQMYYNSQKGLRKHKK